MESQHALRSTVHLNNVGCVLLERHCYSQAKETFDAAIFALEQVAPTADHATVSSTTSSTTATHISDINKSLQLAANRLSNPKTTLLPGIEVKNQMDLKSLPSTLDSTSTTTTIYPVRIEDTEVPLLDSTVMRSVSMCTSITLHNYGLALLCLSVLAQETHGDIDDNSSSEGASFACQSFREQALTILRLALTLFECKFSDTVDIDHFQSILLLCMLHALLMMNRISNDLVIKHQSNTRDVSASSSTAGATSVVKQHALIESEMVPYIRERMFDLVESLNRPNDFVPPCNAARAA